MEVGADVRRPGRALGTDRPGPGQGLRLVRRRCCRDWPGSQCRSSCRSTPSRRVRSRTMPSSSTAGCWSRSTGRHGTRPPAGWPMPSAMTSSSGRCTPCRPNGRLATRSCPRASAAGGPALPAAAASYYRTLFTVADVHATDANDRLQLRREPDGSVRVTLAAGDAPPYLDRRFDPADTREVRVHLHGGDDLAVVRGAAPGGPLVTIIGGNGTNTLVDSSTVAGQARHRAAPRPRARSPAGATSPTRSPAPATSRIPPGTVARGPTTTAPRAPRPRPRRQHASHGRDPHQRRPRVHAEARHVAYRYGVPSGPVREPHRGRGCVVVRHPGWAAGAQHRSPAHAIPRTT